MGLHPRLNTSDPHRTRENMASSVSVEHRMQDEGDGNQALEESPRLTTLVPSEEGDQTLEKGSRSSTLVLVEDFKAEDQECVLQYRRADGTILKKTVSLLK
jgi:hypothetical protein